MKVSDFFGLKQDCEDFDLRNSLDLDLPAHSTPFSTSSTTLKVPQFSKVVCFVSSFVQIWRQKRRWLPNSFHLKLFDLCFFHFFFSLHIFLWFLTAQLERQNSRLLDVLGIPEVHEGELHAQRREELAAGPPGRSFRGRSCVVKLPGLNFKQYVVPKKKSIKILYDMFCQVHQVTNTSCY